MRALSESGRIFDGIGNPWRWGALAYEVQGDRDTSSDPPEGPSGAKQEGMYQGDN